jgi:hypothetical protein
MAGRGRGLAILERVVREIRFDLEDLAMQQGHTGHVGMSAWTEWSRRLDNGDWITLRLRHRSDRTGGAVRGGLLRSRPQAFGGKTRDIGRAEHEYDTEADLAEQQMAEDVRAWLARVKRSSEVA